MRRSLKLIATIIIVLIALLLGAFILTRIISAPQRNSATSDQSTEAAKVYVPPTLRDLTQAYLDAHVAKMLELQAGWNLESATDFAEMNPDQELFILQGDEQLTPDYVEKPFMLASVSKVAVNVAFVRALERAGSLDTQVTIDHATLSELFGRKPSRLISSPKYAKLLEDYPEARELATTAAITETEYVSSDLVDAFSALIPTDIEYEIPVAELLYQVLTLSSNTANDISKKVVAQQGTTIEAELLGIVPEYTSSPVLTAAMEHWRVPLPNVGPISEHVELLHELGQKLQNDELSDGESLVIDGLINNPEDFDLDFTHSTLGKDLISRGYRIIEKTGYYPVVFWIGELNEPPFEYPPHMVLATMASIVPPEGSDEEVLSFGYYQMFAVTLPETTSVFEVEGVKLTFPDSLYSYIQAVSDPIKAIVMPQFREKLVDSLTQLY
jgi:hypothetical protein